MDKAEIQKDIQKLKDNIVLSIKKEDFELALQLIRCAGSILYKSNIRYADDDLEDYLNKIGELFQLKKRRGSDENRVVFYDAFALESRGLAYIYLKALIKNKFHIDYIIEKDRDKDLDHIKDLLSIDPESNFICLKERSEKNRLIELTQVIYDSSAKHLMLYTLPYDEISIIVWNSYKDMRERYLINLTDHAFWMGKNAMDCCIEFRSYGCMISSKFRGIPFDKLKLLPFYPIIDMSAPFEGLPFDWENNRFFFSGGGIYKTFGENNRYYQIVSRILKENKSLIFLYVGNGDTAFLKKLKKDFPQRVFYMEERKDLVEIMKRCCFYFSTYPMWGGLMTQYAVICGKLPLTLRSKKNRFDILLKPEQLHVEFETEEQLMDEIRNILNDEKYRKDRESDLDGQIITEQEFNFNLNAILNGKETVFTIKDAEIDGRLLSDHLCATLSKRDYIKLFVSKYTKQVMKVFPLKVVMGFIYKCQSCFYDRKMI